MINRINRYKILIENMFFRRTNPYCHTNIYNVSMGNQHLKIDSIQERAKDGMSHKIFPIYKSEGFSFIDMTVIDCLGSSRKNRFLLKYVFRNLTTGETRILDVSAATGSTLIPTVASAGKEFPAILPLEREMYEYVRNLVF